MKNLNKFRKIMIHTLVVTLTLSSLTTKIAFASTIQKSERKELITTVENLLTQAKETGVKITFDKDFTDVTDLTEEELNNITALLNFAIQNHTEVKENAALKLKETKSISNKSENNLDSSVIQRVIQGYSNYICRSSIKYAEVNKTVPLNDGSTKYVSTNVAVYARWAYRHTYNGYTGNESNTYYGSNQQYASRGTTISIGQIISFTQNTIGIERATDSSFYVTGTGTYTINCAGLITDFFVPFSQKFSIFDGNYEYTSDSAPW